MREAADARHLSSPPDRVGPYRLRRAVEHLLDGISRSPGSSRFAVRGCWSYAVWLGELHRATRGLDLVDFGGEADPVQLLRMSAGPGRDVAFDWGRASSRRSGRGWTDHLLTTVPVLVDSVRIPVRIILAPHVGDIGHVERVRMRSTASGRLQPLVACMTREWLVGEKAALLVTYGPHHSRVRDVFDLWVIQRRFDMDGPALASAFRAISVGRDAERMLSRRDAYWEGAFDCCRASRAQCSAWEEIADSVPRSYPVPSLQDALEEVAGFLVPALESLRDTGAVRGHWTPGSGWVGTTSARRAATPNQPRLPLFAPGAAHPGVRAARSPGSPDAGWHA